MFAILRARSAIDPVVPRTLRIVRASRAGSSGRRLPPLVVQTGGKSHPDGSFIPRKYGQAAVPYPKTVMKMQRLPGKRTRDAVEGLSLIAPATGSGRL